MLYKLFWLKGLEKAESYGVIGKGPGAKGECERWSQGSREKER